jgi:hypothetical protein
VSGNVRALGKSQRRMPQWALSTTNGGVGNLEGMVGVWKYEAHPIAP